MERIKRTIQPIIFLSVCLFHVSCVNPFAPELDDASVNNGNELGDQTTVDGVFKNFKQAYAFRDSTIYGQLLDQNFIFIYRDYDKGVDVFWGRDDEVRTTYGLFQNVQRLDLVWNTIIAESGDSVKLTIVRNFNLTVTFTASDVVRVDGYANLTLQRNNPAAAWKITRWQDESNF